MTLCAAFAAAAAAVAANATVCHQKLFLSTALSYQHTFARARTIPYRVSQFGVGYLSLIDD